MQEKLQARVIITEMAKFIEKSLACEEICQKMKQTCTWEEKDKLYGNKKCVDCVIKYFEILYL